MNRELVFIGLGRMGSAMTAHLVEKGYVVHGFDTNENARVLASQNGVMTHNKIEKAIQALTTKQRVIWIMVPSCYVENLIEKLRPLLIPDDTIIDGGNSFFQDTIRRHHDLQGSQIHYIDCGTSGGIDGARNGASLMVGGTKTTVTRHEHIFKTLAVKNGYGYVGGAGAGHFVKMVHNGIEYGMMGAIAEGINVLHEHRGGLELDIREALKPYKNGSIIASSLMNWLSDAYHEAGYLEKIAGEVPQGETEMEMEYLINHENVRVLDVAVLQRKLTRLEPSFIGTLISAMRNQFGGHKTLETKKKM